LGCRNPSPGIRGDVSFFASAAPILQCGATPVFCDVDERTLTADPDDVERRITPRTRAICVVHMWGNPAALDRLQEIARRHDIALIEDCSHDRVQVFGVTGGLPPICPPTVRLGPSAHLQAGALVLSAACDQPCSLSIGTAVREGGKVQRTTARRSLGLGVARVQLRVALPTAARRALRAGVVVRVRISVRPTGFAGTGQALSRQLQLRS
jgi:hypothetical protein